MSSATATRRGAVATHLSALCVVGALTACGDDTGPSGSSDAAVAADARADDRRDSSPGGSPDSGIASDAGENVADCSIAGDQLLANPEFDDAEDTIEPWEQTGEVDLIVDPGDYSVDTFPNGVAVLGGIEGEGSARLSQRVEIPKRTTELTLSVKLCIRNEEIHGDPDELTIALESAEGDELDVLATFTSLDNDEINCSYVPASATVDPAGRYDGEVAHLVVSAETSENDRATFFMDTFALRASCP